MKKILCLFLCCIMLCSAPPAAYAEKDVPSVFIFLSYYEKYLDLSNLSNFANPQHCYVDKNSGVYCSDDASIIILFSLDNGSNFPIKHIALSSSNIRGQIIATVLAFKAYAYRGKSPTSYINEWLNLAYTINDLGSGQSYSCDEFTVINDGGCFNFIP